MDFGIEPSLSGTLRTIFLYTIGVGSKQQRSKNLRRWESAASAQDLVCPRIWCSEHLYSRTDVGIERILVGGALDGNSFSR